MEREMCPIPGNGLNAFLLAKRGSCDCLTLTLPCRILIVPRSEVHTQKAEANQLNAHWNDNDADTKPVCMACARVEARIVANDKKTAGTVEAMADKVVLAAKFSN